jgi:hypothetical protein
MRQYITLLISVKAAPMDDQSAGSHEQESEALKLELLEHVCRQDQPGLVQ